VHDRRPQVDPSDEMEVVRPVGHVLLENVVDGLVEDGDGALGGETRRDLMRQLTLKDEGRQEECQNGEEGKGRTGDARDDERLSSKDGEDEGSHER
jgi:hypothetical protein